MQTLHRAQEPEHETFLRRSVTSVLKSIIWRYFSAKKMLIFFICEHSCEDGRNVWHMPDAEVVCSHIINWKQTYLDEWRDLLLLPPQCSFHSLFRSECPSHVSASVCAVSCPDDTVNLTREVCQLDNQSLCSSSIKLTHLSHILSGVVFIGKSGWSFTVLNFFFTLTLLLLLLGWNSSDLYGVLHVFVSMPDAVRLP